MTKNREIRKLPKELILEIEEFKKNSKINMVYDDKIVNKYLKECNSLIKKLNEYKLGLLSFKNKKKYALNISFPITKRKRKYN